MAKRTGPRKRSQCWLDPALYREIKTVAAILGRQVGDVADDIMRRGLPAFQKRADEMRAVQVRAKNRRAADRKAQEKRDGDE